MTIHLSVRGFPPGYIATLEKRLLETELALFETLSLVVREQGSDVNLQEAQFQVLLAGRSANQSKEARVDEWQRLPLQTHQQRYEWWKDKCSKVDSIPSPRAPPPHRSESVEGHSYQSQSSLRSPELQEGSFLLGAHMLQRQTEHFAPAAFSSERNFAAPSENRTPAASLDLPTPFPMDAAQAGLVTETGPSADSRESGSQSRSEVTRAQRLSSAQWQRFF